MAGSRVQAGLKRATKGEADVLLTFALAMAIHDHMDAAIGGLKDDVSVAALRLSKEVYDFALAGFVCWRVGLSKGQREEIADRIDKLKHTAFDSQEQEVLVFVNMVMDRITRHLEKVKAQDRRSVLDDILSALTGLYAFYDPDFEEEGLIEIGVRGSRVLMAA